MKRGPLLITLVLFLLSACNLPQATQVIPAAKDQTDPSSANSAAATEPATATLTGTFTSTYTLTPTETLTFTSTFTPTITPTATIAATPTFQFPKLTVKVANLACKFGPAKAYLWKFDLHQGDTGVVWGRAPIGDWLYVKMDRLNDGCWLHPAYVDIVGDIKTVGVQQVRLWITDALYAPPSWVRATRKGDVVTVSWARVEMTEDDDRGYFLDVYVCQNGNYVWMPTSFPDQYTTSMDFTDQPGCSMPSGGKLYAVEKHGYIPPVDIPWPGY